MRLYRLCLLLLVCVLVPATARAYQCFTGLETGAITCTVASTLGAGGSIVTSPVITGGYSLKQGSGGASTIGTGSSGNSRTDSFSFRSSGTDSDLAIWQSSAAATMMTLSLSSGKLRVTNGSNGCNITQTTGSTTLVTGQDYLIRTALDRSAGGVIKIWLNDSLEINITHSSACTGTAWYSLLVTGPANPNEYLFDDYAWDQGSTTQPAAGIILGRQGTSGSPTYTGGTITCADCGPTRCSGSCATGTSCCALSDSPFNTSRYVLITDGASNTMNVCAFDSASCTGSGSQTLASETVNACRTVWYGHRGTGTAPANCTGGGSPYCGIWILNGVVTVGSAMGGTSDAYTISPQWTPGANSYLNTMEVGGRKGAGTGRDITMNDVWVECDVQVTTTTTSTSSSTSSTTSTSTSTSTTSTTSTSSTTLPSSGMSRRIFVY